jgi:hypothetical protein
MPNGGANLRPEACDETASGMPGLNGDLRLRDSRPNM